MAMVIKNNMSAIGTLNVLRKNNDSLAKDLKKVSTGTKITGAADDASRRQRERHIQWQDAVRRRGRHVDDRRADRRQGAEQRVMDENIFQGSTLSFYYRADTRNTKFIKDLGLSSARLGFTMEDLFYISSVKRERGLDYPFSRQFTFSLNVAF